jgi:hypothetical protein
MTTAEFLSFPPSAKYRAGKAPDLPAALFRSLLLTARANGVHATTTPRYLGASDWLVLYGPGGLDRAEPMRRQKERGGRVICWDAPYWDRGTKLRVSIDHAHPQAWVMRHDWPIGRLVADGVEPGAVWDPDGPILVAGIGAKARAQYGHDLVRAWETQQVAECRARWPGRPVYYRPKPHHPEPPVAGAIVDPPHAHWSIDHALAGVSLVVTWHSNVAVDAIRLGVPVVCADGAAAAVCRPGVATLVGANPAPLDVETRDQFLANLAWFQWAPDEAASCWRFLRALLATVQKEARHGVR